MSAYMKDLVTRCYREGCKSRAVVEVFNTWNASQGVFCRSCGRQLVTHLKRGEREQGNAEALAYARDYPGAEDR